MNEWMNKQEVGSVVEFKLKRQDVLTNPVSEQLTYIFGWSQVEEQVIRRGGFNVEGDGVVPPFPDIGSVTTETVTTWWHWHFDLRRRRGTRIRWLHALLQQLQFISILL